MSREIPNIWRPGDSLTYKNQVTGRTIEAICIDDEDYKILRKDVQEVLFHTSNIVEFRLFIRYEMLDNYVELEEITV